MSDLLRLSVPLTLWLALFSLVYGLHGVICSLGGSEGRGLLVGVWICGIVVQAALCVALAGRFAAPSPVIRRASLALAVTALVATAWSLFPVALLPLC